MSSGYGEVTVATPLSCAERFLIRLLAEAGFGARSSRQGRIYAFIAAASGRAAGNWPRWRALRPERRRRPLTRGGVDDDHRAMAGSAHLRFAHLCHEFHTMPGHSHDVAGFFTRHALSYFDGRRCRHRRQRCDEITPASRTATDCARWLSFFMKAPRRRVGRPPAGHHMPGARVYRSLQLDTKCRRRNEYWGHRRATYFTPAP